MSLRYASCSAPALKRRRKLGSCLACHATRQLGKLGPVNAEIRWVVILEKDIKKIEQAMSEVVTNDVSLAKLFSLITSVIGVGMITAVELICFTNEFKMYTEAKQLACYCGVAPFEHTSGTSVRGKTRVSRMANKSLKTKLHLCAMEIGRAHV